MISSRPSRIVSRLAGAIALALALSGAAVASSAAADASADPSVYRVDGADRYEVAVNVSKQAWRAPFHADVVYVATGRNYPDALSAGPAAALEGGPLLLTGATALRTDVKAEIVRLEPKKIVVVGGPTSISPSVFDELTALQSNTVRIDGADRYEASRNLASYVFGKYSPRTVYLATGANFPDALSAGATAALSTSPVILVKGGESSVDSDTLELLTTWGTTTVRIAGGPNSVSPGIESSLQSAGKNVERYGGADRYAVSVAINAGRYTHNAGVYFVTGSNFPDALAGSALAGDNGLPLYVVRQDCVPAATLAAVRAQGPDWVTLIGGPASMSENVAALKSCG